MTNRRESLRPRASRRVPRGAAASPATPPPVADRATASPDALLHRARLLGHRLPILPPPRLPDPGRVARELLQRYSATAVDSSDEDAAPAISGRNSSESPKLQNNWASVAAHWRGTTIGPFVAASAPGGSALLHAERTAVRLLCDKLGVTFSQASGTSTGEALRDEIDGISIFTELPPCGGCDPWLTALEKALQADVFLVKFHEETDGYWKAKTYQRKKLFGKYIDSVTS
jgi:hypothetical protein